MPPDYNQCSAHMLIYLDHAQLVELERADPAERGRFFKCWRSAGAELALSFHHLQEAVQLSDALSVGKWLNVLSMFGPIRSAFASFATVLEFEVQVQMILLLGHDVEVRRSALDTFFPPTTVAAVAQRLQSLESALREMRAIHELEADALEIGKQASRGSPPVSLRRKMAPELLDTLDLDKMLADADVDVSPQTMALTRKALKGVREAIAKTGTGRAALGYMARVDGSVIRNVADEDLSAALPFLAPSRETVDAVARRAGTSRQAVEAVLPLLNPYAAPGVSLRLAVRRGLRTHPRPEVPGNQIDVDHVTFAPYVDVLFADAHTTGLISQDRRSRSDRLPPGAGANVARAGNLEVVIDTINAYRPEA